jgi:hypothetical protein
VHLAPGWCAGTSPRACLAGVTASRCEVTVRGPLSHALLEVVRTRFDRVATPAADGTVLVVEAIDQAAVRALLTLLWDADHEVLALRAYPASTTLPSSADDASSGCAGSTRTV